jgi:PAS domain S-box/diguanylate cyclase (GGDEF) domain
MIFSQFALPSILSAVIMLGLYLFTQTHYRKSVGAHPFMAIMLSGFAWALGYALMLMSISPTEKIFWFNLSQLGPDFSGVFWLILAVEFTGQWPAKWKWWWILTLIIPVVSTVLMWTNSSHHLVRLSMTLMTSASGVTYFSIQHGLWFWVEVIYGYSASIIALFFLAWFWFWSSPSKPTNSLILAMLIPFISNVLEVFGVNPLTPYGSTAVLFSLSGLILAWGLFRDHLFEITPIARNRLFDNIGEGILVVDQAFRVVDANPAARRLFNPGSKGSLIGQNIFTSILTEAEKDSFFSDISTTGRIKKFTFRNSQYFYDVNVSRLFTGNRNPVGWVIIFHDVTGQIELNKNLANNLQEIQELQIQMHDELAHDPLTGCFNRRYLNEVLPYEMAQADRNHTTVGLIMLDIDHFKTINDNYGHATGDRVLQSVGQELMNFVRRSDKVFRYGGEEFLLVLPEITLSKATERAQKLCESFSQFSVSSLSGKTINLTVSCGVAVYPLHAETLNEIIDKVDQAMYAAKRAGRNRIFVYQSSIDK